MRAIPKQSGVRQNAFAARFVIGCRNLLKDNFFALQKSSLP